MSIIESKPRTLRKLLFIKELNQNQTMKIPSK